MAPERLTALVYRGPASCAGCAETLAERLSSSPPDMNVAFIGPNEELPLEASSLSGADLYARAAETMSWPPPNTFLHHSSARSTTSSPTAVATSACAWAPTSREAMASAFWSGLLMGKSAFPGFPLPTVQMSLWRSTGAAPCGGPTFRRARGYPRAALMRTRTKRRVTSPQRAIASGKATLD